MMNCEEEVMTWWFPFRDLLFLHILSFNIDDESVSYITCSDTIETITYILYRCKFDIGCYIVVCAELQHISRWWNTSNIRCTNKSVHVSNQFSIEWLSMFKCVKFHKSRYQYLRQKIINIWRCSNTCRHLYSPRYFIYSIYHTILLFMTRNTQQGEILKILYVINKM